MADLYKDAAGVASMVLQTEEKRGRPPRLGLVGIIQSLHHTAVFNIDCSKLYRSSITRYSTLLKNKTNWMPTYKYSNSPKKPANSTAHNLSFLPTSGDMKRLRNSYSWPVFPKR